MYHRTAVVVKRGRPLGALGGVVQHRSVAGKHFFGGGMAIRHKETVLEEAIIARTVVAAVTADPGFLDHITCCTAVSPLRQFTVCGLDHKPGRSGL